MWSRGRHTALALSFALSASLQAAALAQGELDEALIRAREGLSLSRRDREVAAGLLREWRGSEEAAPGTGDSSLGRALEAMAAGRALAPDETGALRRYETSCRRDRLGAVQRHFPGTRARPPGTGPGGSSRRSRVGRGLAAWWLVPAAGAAVVVLGAVWMLAARIRRGR